MTRLALEERDEPWSTFDDPPEQRVAPQTYERQRFVVEAAGGQVVGSMSAIRVPHGPNQRSLAWNIGIYVAPSWRGQAIGARAQRLLAAELFATSEANRVEASTDVGNRAEQKALERAGFTREGVCRGAQWRQGEWHDVVLYSRLRSDG